MLIDDLTHMEVSRHAARKHLDAQIDEPSNSVDDVEKFVEQWGLDEQAEQEMNSEFWERF